LSTQILAKNHLICRNASANWRIFDPFYFMRTGVPHRMLLPHRHFAAEQLPYEIKPNGKRIVEWLAIRRVIYLRSSFPSLCKLYEHKNLRREWFFCADFYVMLIKLCLLYYVN